MNALPGHLDAAPQPPLRSVPSALDRPLTVTFFANRGATFKVEETLALRELAGRIRDATAETKDALPWLKLAAFGDQRTARGALRHDGNVLAISGIEADYDAGTMSVDAARDVLAAADVAAVLYTSPSHTEDAPRWRVLCPLTEEAPPAARAALVARINGLFGGALAAESFTLSQSFYFGSVRSNPSHRVVLIEGRPIDLAEELDTGAIGRPARAQPDPSPAPAPAHLYHPAEGGTGYGRAALASECDAIRAAAEGSKHDTLNKAAFSIGGLVGAGALPEGEAFAALSDAVADIRPACRDFRAAERTLRRAFDDGKGAPRTVPEMTVCEVDGIVDGVDMRAFLAKIGALKVPTAAAAGDTLATPAAANGATTSRLHIVNPASLAGQFAPPRAWIVMDWLPVGHVTANYGDGGTGKTLVAQQLMAACATGTPWLGLAVTQCRSFALFCEDDEAELHRRQAAINEAFGLDFGALEAMRWVSGVGADNTLATFGADGAMHVKPLFHELKQAASDHGARLVILDTAADLFAGNENDRGQVRRFIGLLNRLAQDIGGAVLLNAHPSRTGLNSGALDGGSTAWSNSVRSRWSLAYPPAAQGEEPDTSKRILTRRKANYSAIGDTIRLNWSNGTLRPAVTPTALAGHAKRADAARVFLTLLDRCEGSGVRVSHSKNAGNWAPAVFAKRPDAEGFTRKDFDAAMSALFASEDIEVQDYGRKGDPRWRIVPTNRDRDE